MCISCTLSAPNVPNIPALVEEIAAPLSTQTTIKVKFSLDWFLNTDNGERTDGGIIVCPASSCDNYGNIVDMLYLSWECQSVTT